MNYKKTTLFVMAGCLFAIGCEYFLFRMTIESWVAMVAAGYLLPLLLQTPARIRPAVSWMYCTLAMCLYALAAIGDSPWLAVLSSIVFVWCIVVRWQPHICITALLGWQMLTLFVLPLPDGVSNKIVPKLQLVSSNMASMALEYLQIIHLHEGNIITLPTKQLFVAEACSGIIGLHSVLLVLCIIGVHQKKQLPAIVTSLLLGVCVVVVCNALRIATIAIAESWYQVDITEGGTHATIGIVTNVLALIICGCLMQVLDAISSSFDEYGDIFIKWTHGEKIQPLSKFVWTALCCIMLSLLWIHFTMNRAKQTNALAVTVTADVLPENLNGWRLTEVTDREWSLDVRSKVWTYTNDGRTVRIAVDYPFTGLHQLEICYQGIGYTLEGKLEEPDRVRCFLSKDNQDFVLDYALMDTEQQNSHQGWQSELQQHLNRLGIVSEKTYYQVQVLSRAQELGEGERKALLLAAKTRIFAFLQKSIDNQ